MEAEANQLFTARGPEPKQEKNRPNKTNRGIQLPPGFVCFAQRYPGNIHSAHVLFGATNTRAGWCWQFVSHGQTNKPESRVFHSFSYTNTANNHRMPMPMRMKV